MPHDTHHVLVVDDEKDYLKDFSLLYSKKFNLLTACGGEEGLKVLGSAPVGVVVSDQRMPGMSGSEFLAEVCRRKPETVRILLTGYADLEAVIDAVNRGEIYRYVSKDLPLKELEIVIRQAVEKHELEEKNRGLLKAKESLLKTIAVQEHLSIFGTFGQKIHQQIERLVMSLSSYLFDMGREGAEKEALAEFQRIQGALARLRELTIFGDRLRVVSASESKADLNQLIEGLVSRARKSLQAEKRNCEIQVDLASSLPEVPFHSYSLQRVLKELLENAILFSPREGGAIHVRTRVVGNDREGRLPFGRGVEVEIEDHGCGMEDGDLAKVFAPFFTTLPDSLPPSGVRPPSPDEFNLGNYFHFGFGLPIAQWIVSARHQGALDISSQSGRGTIARVALPVGAA